MRRISFGLATLCAAVTCVGAARADWMQISDRSALTGQTIDWSAFGPAGTDLSTPDSQSFGGVTAEVGSSAGVAEVRREDTDFTGNFAPGAALLSLPDGYKSDVFGVRLSGAPIYGVGTQIQPVSGYLGAFTGIMDFYGAGNTLLGEVSVNGLSSTADDGSAAFLGAASSVPITYVRFFVSEGNPFFPREGDLAIDGLSLQQNAIPEPGAFLLFATGIFGIAMLRRR